MNEQSKQQTPQRIQRSRRKGSKVPQGTICVTRPSRWGNPFVVTGDYPVEQAVMDYERWLLTDLKGIETLRDAKVELRGKNLACWCKPGHACHADVLIKLVN